MAKLIRFKDYKATRRPVYFTQRELQTLLCEYARRVQRGEWRDYAIDHRPGMAVFSVFRSSRERPLYSVVKLQANDDGASFVVNQGRQRLRAGRSLDDVLPAIGHRLQVVSQ
ncbi:MAG: DUF2794 domain-containing protein [Dongiaceae bacterium]